MQRATRKRSDSAEQSDLFDRLGREADPPDRGPAAAAAWEAPPPRPRPANTVRPADAPQAAPSPAPDRSGEAGRKVGAEVAGLRAALETLAFAPLENGVRSAAEALYVLGWHGGMDLDADALGRRFRALALVYHPDTGAAPSGPRMAQLVEARNLLARQIGRRRRLRFADMLARGEG
ncbi:MAG: hypothetical protein H6843_01785 [Rhodospirillaceae bacterium]|nr:hypothetical protein [Rhodospirillaceae bacterium]